MIESAPHTLIHNDCTPRNSCIRHAKHLPNSSGPFFSTQHGSISDNSDSTTSAANSDDSVPFQDPRTLCIYDWEMAAIGVPQWDVVEFLSFTLLPSASREVWLNLLEFYRQHLEYYSGNQFPAKK